jgi:hypothetical protein
MTEVLLPCPFCGGEVQHRFALWPSDGNVDAIMHAQPSECGLPDFSVGTADSGKAVAAAWNHRIAGQAELRELLRELYDWSNKTANGLMWRFADQPIAKKVEAALSAAPFKGGIA